MPITTPDEIRARWDILANYPKVTDGDLERLVASFEGLAERARGVAFVPRTETAVVYGGRYSPTVWLPRRHVTAVTAVTIDGHPLTGDELAALELDELPGTVTRLGVGWGRRAVLTFTHGLPEVPAGIHRACLEFVRAKAVVLGTEDGPRNAISYTDPQSGWVMRESTADWSAGRYTGVQEIDNAINAEFDYRQLDL